jgi:hypothetical protein
MKDKQKNERQYLKTFLSESNEILDVYIGGIKHQTRTPHDNDIDGFHFVECEQLDFIHTLGTVYLFRDKQNILWGYTCAGYTWYRFSFNELILLAN